MNPEMPRCPEHIVPSACADTALSSPNLGMICPSQIHHFEEYPRALCDLWLWSLLRLVLGLHPLPGLLNPARASV